MIANDSMPKILVRPRDNDVLCGRGMQYFNHPGNHSLRVLTVLNLDEYLVCKRKREKTTIIRSVIRTIFNYGGRFLRYNSLVHSWYDGGLPAAKLRVGVAFRDAKAPQKVRYVKDMLMQKKAGLLHVVNNCGIHGDQRNPHATSTASPSSLVGLIQGARRPSLSSNVAKPQSPAKRIRSKDLVLPSDPTNFQSMISSLHAPMLTSTAASDPFEPRPVDSNDEDTGIATAQSLLQVLSDFDDGDDDSFCSSEESLAVCGNYDSLEEMEPINNEHSKESFLGDFIRSNELFLDDFIQMLSNGVLR